jgi:hypothetical protein
VRLTFRAALVRVCGNRSDALQDAADWDEPNWTVKQDAVKPFLKARYRSPWKLEV